MRTEWPRHEESVREVSASAHVNRPPYPSAQNGPSTPVSTNPFTRRGSVGPVRVTHLVPLRTEQTETGDIVTTEEFLKEDDATETVVRRKTIHGGRQYTEE